MPYNLPGPIDIPKPSEVAEGLGNVITSPSDALVKDKRVHLSKIVHDAGWTDPESNKDARGVIIAESGARATVINRAGCGKNHDGSKAVAVGLMQICTVHAGTRGIPKDINQAIKYLQNPANNIKVGRSLFVEQGWGPWQAYTNGSYKKYRDKDPMLTIDKNSLTDNNIVNAVDDVTSAAGDVAQITGKVVAALFDPSTYLRLGKGALGASFIVLGTGAIVFIVANKAAKSPVGKSATKAAASAAVLIPK